MPGSPLSYEPSYRSIRIIKRDYKPRLLPSPFCEAKNFPSDRIFRRQEWKDRLSVQIERKLEIFLYIIRGEIRWNLIERGTKKEETIQEGKSFVTRYPKKRSSLHYVELFVDIRQIVNEQTLCNEKREWNFPFGNGTSRRCYATVGNLETRRETKRTKMKRSGSRNGRYT